MRRSSCCSWILALLVLFQCTGIVMFAASSKGSSISESVPVDSLPSAPGLSLNLSTHGYVRHPQHVMIPRIEVAPRLSDFLMVRPRSSTVREMLRINHFIQRNPDDGKPPTEQTVAYLGYTRKYFYLAFVCHDKAPKLIRSHMLARDTTGDDDNVQVFLDTFHDQRRAFIFQSNALGIQTDALYSEQEGYDFSFDTVWDTWGKRTPFGYVALMRIPFASLYFTKAAPNQMRTWGIILARVITHKNEAVYWPRSTHNVAGLLTQDIAADGFMNIAHGQNWQFEPYVLG